eukprot:UN00056
MVILLATIPRSANGQLQEDLRDVTGFMTNSVFKEMDLGKPKYDMYTKSYAPPRGIYNVSKGINYPVIIKTHHPWIGWARMVSNQVVGIIKTHRDPLNNF